MNKRVKISLSDDPLRLTALFKHRLAAESGLNSVNGIELRDVLHDFKMPLPYRLAYSAGRYSFVDILEIKGNIVAIDNMGSAMKFGNRVNADYEFTVENFYIAAE